MAFRALAVSKKKNAKEKAKEEAEGRKEQEAIRKMLCHASNHVIQGSNRIRAALEKAAKAAGLKLSAPVRKAILSALSERDETAEIAATTTTTRNPIPSSATPKTCRSPKASKLTLNAK